MSKTDEEIFVFDDDTLSSMKLLGESNKGCKNFRAKNDTDELDVFVRKWEFDSEKLQFKCPISCQNIATQKCDDHGHGCSNIETIVNELRERTDFVIRNVVHTNLVHYININTEGVRNEKLIVCLAQEWIDGMSIKNWRDKHGKRHNIVDIARDVLKAIECLNNISERITHNFLNTSSIFIDQSGKCRVSDFHLVPYLMYLKSDHFLLNQCSDVEALASVIKSENETNYQLANDFIDRCRSKDLLFVDNLLKHSFISNALCGSDIKTNQDDRLLEHFEIQNCLGEGSYGQVFKARNQIDKKMYAIKLIPIPAKKSQRNRMDREVEVLSQLKHKYIAKYITSWKQSMNLTWLSKYMADGHVPKKREHDNPDRLIIQMEIYSHNLRTEIQDAGLFDHVDRIKQFFDEICLGLSFIHTRNVIHRDLKPENIFIDSARHVKIGDFGLATTTSLVKQNQPQIYKGYNDNNRSQTGVVGTSKYIAPELLKGAANALYWNKVDVYSLGIIFFEMFRPPPNDISYDEILIFDDLRSSKIIIPKSFEDKHPCEASLLMKMLNHNPEDRPLARKVRQLYAKIQKSDEISIREIYKEESQTMDWDEEF